MFRLQAHGYAAHMLIYFPTLAEAEREKRYLITAWGFNRETVEIEAVL